MASVKSILERKGTEVVVSPPGATIGAVARQLVENRIGAVVISRDGMTVEGLYSERDLVNHISKYGPTILDNPVSSLMTRGVPSCSPGDNLKDIMRVMTQRRTRHLPVIEEGRLAGIISIGDVVKSRLEDMQLEANVLRDYTIALR